MGADDDLTIFGDREQSLDHDSADSVDGDETSSTASPADGQPRRAIAAAKPKRRRRAILFGFLALVLVGGLGIVGFVSAQVQGSLNRMQRDPGAMPTADRPAEATPGPTAPPLNIVLVGTDSRGPGDRGRSDSLMVVHIPGDRKAVYFISFPRDSWVDIPGKGRAKINAAYSWGGTALSVQTLESILQTRMDHVAMTNFDNFIGLVDVVGGVTVFNPAQSQIDNITFAQGDITLDGKRALIYCRERYDLANGDLDRARRQRDVLKSIVQKAASPEVLANPAKVSELIAAFGKYVTVDSDFTTAKTMELALSMRLDGGSSIRALQAPLLGFSTSTDGQAIDVIDYPGWQALGEAMRNDQVAAYFSLHQYDHAKPMGSVPSPK